MASFDRRSFHLKNLALLLIIVLIAPSTPLNVVIAANPASDYTALLAFQSSTDFSQKLATNWSGQDPCSLTHRWYGVTCRNGRVIRLVLQGLQLTGTIDALVSLDQLRILSLSDNSFTGSLPNLTCWKYLRFLYLSNNAFTGTVPDSISALFRLFRMDLSNNALSGNIPSSLDLLSDLLTLRLQNNQLSGTIPSLNLSRLEEFNVSGNQLSGPIPFSVSNFPISSFRGNSELCGTPLLVCDSNQPWSPSMSNPMVVASTPSTKPSSLDDVTKQAPAPAKVGTREVIAIVLGDIGILLLVTCFCLLYLHWSRICQYSPAQSKGPKIKRSDSAVVSRNYAAQEGGGRMLVSLDGKKPMELEDLLRASADILGKGSFGTTYKAVLEDGSSVVVKRLKDVAASVDRREFERQMELIGRTKHRNLVCLRAYFYAREAKLIVYDYLPSGNLFSLLHGNRGPGRTPLDWKPRLKIALGAARGLAYIHHGCVSQKCFHGNIKSSNVLLDRDGNAYISDFGLVSLARPSVVTSGSIGYRAPELAETWKKVSQASDVYSFGVLLLETLTGKAPMTAFYMHGDNHESIDLPKWVQSVAREEWTSELFDVELLRCKEAEEEMVNMLQVAIMCVRWSPEQRPKMREVVKMIENITGDHDYQHSDQTHDSIDSPSVSPLVSSEEGVFQNHYSINVI